MQSRNWVPVVPLASLFVLQATASYGQEAIGKATSVRPQAEGIRSGSTRTLSGGSDVYSKETVRIRTGDTGQANLQFHDDINLSVGPQSSVHLEKYVYDPNKSAGTIAVQAARGSLRFATGSQGDGSYQIKTPYGTLGYRSFEECRPNVIAGNHGFCNPNPSQQASQRGSKTIAKSEKAIAVKKESSRHRANATTAIKLPTVKPKTVATAAKPTVATQRTEPAEEKANSRTITEPDVTASVQPSATSIPVPNKATTTIGGKTEGPASDHPAEMSNPVPKKPITIGAKTESPTSGQPSETSDPVPKKEPTTIGAKTEGPASDQPSETSDPVLKKAKITVAAKMEDPTYAEFADMKRVMRKNSFGEHFEIICGHVKGKMKSGEATGDRPFLYLVKEDEVFIVGGNPDSMAAIVYRAQCVSANSR